jgi:hypothetical protein
MSHRFPLAPFLDFARNDNWMQVTLLAEIQTIHWEEQLEMFFPRRVNFFG